MLNISAHKNICPCQLCSLLSDFEFGRSCKEKDFEASEGTVKSHSEASGGFAFNLTIRKTRIKLGKHLHVAWCSIIGNRFPGF